MDTESRTSLTISSIIRLIARLISIAYLSFIVILFTYAVLKEGLPGGKSFNDFAPLIMLGSYLFGLLLAWKRELTGAFVSLAAITIWTIISPEFRTITVVNFLYVLPISLFLLCGWMSRSVPAGERKAYPLLKTIKARYHVRYSTMLLVGCITVFTLCVFLSNKDFLPFLKYREIKDIDEMHGHSIEIRTTNDGVYELSGRTSFTYSRLYITWWGDTTETLISGHGYLRMDRIKNSIEDTLIASVSKNIITPHKIGKTTLLCPISSKVDTIPIEVYKKPTGLAVSLIYDYETALEKDPAAQLVTPPFIVQRPKITFPDSLLHGQKQVKVLVSFTIDTTGKPLLTKILRSEDDRFNQLAEAFANQYRFEADQSPDHHPYRFKILPIVFTKSQNQAFKKNSLE